MCSVPPASSKKVLDPSRAACTLVLVELGGLNRARDLAGRAVLSQVVVERVLHVLQIAPLCSWRSRWSIENRETPLANCLFVGELCRSDRPIELDQEDGIEPMIIGGSAVDRQGGRSAAAEVGVSRVNWAVIELARDRQGRRQGRRFRPRALPSRSSAVVQELDRAGGSTGPGADGGHRRCERDRFGRGWVCIRYRETGRGRRLADGHGARRVVAQEVGIARVDRRDRGRARRQAGRGDARRAARERSRAERRRSIHELDGSGGRARAGADRDDVGRERHALPEDRRGGRRS